MICKRCDVKQVKPERMVNGYCRHCQGALLTKVYEKGALING